MRCPIVLLVTVSLLSAGCGDDPAPDGDAGGSDAGAEDAGAGASDAGPVDAGTPDVCDALGLPRRAMLAGTGHEFGDLAGDFTVETLDGSFHLADEWTGCESYVFINHVDTPEGLALWRSFADPLFARSSRNVRYFFASYETFESRVRVHVEDMRMNVEEAFSRMSPEDAAFWRDRVHYVTTPLTEVEGSIGDLVRSHSGQMPAFAIDRRQRFDPVGSLSMLVSSGWVSRLEMAGFASRYYDWRVALEDRLAAETDATVVPLVDETDFSTRVFVREATLPDAATMADFDTLEVDVEVVCRRNWYDCSEWDRIAAVELCEDPTCGTRRELVRWITPYARPGSRRWLMDASPLLGLLREGGRRTFRITLGPDWEEPTERDVAISLRLADRDTGDRALGADLAFTGGTFDATYAEAHPPFHFTPPDGTAKVELVVIVSGHGQTEGNNCAEWCNHVHDFTVNGGTTHRIDFPGEAGTPFGCAEHVDDGVIPGQYGNWAPGRAAWCPGWPVAARRIDVTEDVDLAGDNELTYDASFAGGPPSGGNIVLSAYVVYYE